MGDFTYEHLFDVVRRERSREELQELEDGFYSLSEGYIYEQAEKARKADVLSSEGDKSRTQLQNAKKLLKELYDRREKKIMLLALNKARTDSSLIDISPLLSKEKDLFNNMVDLLRKNRVQLTPMTNGLSTEKSTKEAPPQPAPIPKKKEVPQEEKTDSDTTNVKIVSSVPKFLGGNEETFGPYSEGTEITLPSRIARVLIKKGRAEET